MPWPPKRLELTDHWKDPDGVVHKIMVIESSFLEAWYMVHAPCQRRFKYHRERRNRRTEEVVTCLSCLAAT